MVLTRSETQPSQEELAADVGVMLNSVGEVAPNASSQRFIVSNNSFNNISKPKASSISPGSLATLWITYQNYVNQWEGSNSNTVPASLWHCFTSDQRILLEEFIEGDLTPASLQAYVQSCASLETESDFVPISSQLAAIKMDMRIPSAIERCCKYFEKFQSVLTRYSYTDKLKSNPKEYIKLLAAGIKPPELNITMQNCMALQELDAKSNLIKFRKLLIRKAVSHEEVEISQNMRKRQMSTPAFSNTSSKKPRSIERSVSTRPSTSMKHRNINIRSAKTQNTDDKRMNATQHRKIVCFNPDCKGSHHLNDCPRAPTAEQKTAIMVSRKNKFSKTQK